MGGWKGWTVMNWWMWIVVIGLLLFLLVLITKLTIDISYYHRKDDDELKVKMTIWRFISYTISAPLVKIDKESKSVVVEEEKKSAITKEKKKLKITPDMVLETLKDVRRFLEHVVGFHYIVRRFLKHVTISQFDWKSKLGVQDAAYTAVLAGMGWSIKGAVVGILSKYMRLKTRPRLDVTPAYEQPLSQTELRCMISFRLGYAIVAAILIVRHWKKGVSLFAPMEKKAREAEGGI